MGLQIWLPLLGSTTQQGLSNATVIGCSATINNSGKIGKCYSFDGTGNQYIIGTQSYFTNSTTKEWSYACWIKVNNSHNGCIWSCRTATATTGMTILYYSGQWIFDDGERWHFTPKTTLSANTWYHICFTRSANTGKRCFYLNGTLDSTASTGASTTTVCTTHFAIGDSQTSAQSVYGNPFNGYLNDVRVYDHCLSSKEVEILARGLVLHYPMTGGGRGQVNLYDFETVASKWTNEGETSLTNYVDSSYGNVLKISSVASKRIYRSVSNVWTTSGGKYTVSFLAKASTNGATCDMSRSLVDYSPTFTLTTNWKKYSGTITLTDTSSSGTLSFRTLTAADYYITQIKLEVGEIATNYIPGVGDSHYNSMGYNDTIEYDVSGYLHNGTINGSVSYSSNTARYSVSTEFSKAGYVNVPSFNVDTSAFTLNFWVKMKTATSQHFVLGTFTSWTGNGIGVYRDTNSINYQCIIRSAGESTYGGLVLPLTIGSWYMLTLTYDGTNYKGYLNGVLKQNVTYGSSGVVSNPVFMVGNSKFNSTPASENEEALISDVRMYATALTPTQVAELYNTAISISNNGALLGYEFVET